MFKLVIVAALVAVTAADSGGGGSLYSDGLTRTRLTQQCAGVCKDSTKFSLQPGWTYVYGYEGTTTSEVTGSSNETSQIKVLAKAHVRVSSRPCELILVIRDVQLLDSDGDSLSHAVGQKEFAAELEQFPLRFSYQDGRVEQLCPSADETTWALNIKRGLLSMFQNSMSDLSKDGHMYEKDVSGSCETTYTASPMMWSDVKVLKFKNLQSCGGRGRHTLGMPASWTSGAKSTPIIKSEQICEQTIRTDNGTYLANSRCQETHVFAPFSNGQSGIRTIAEVSLALDSITQSEDVIPVDLFVNKRTNLLFEYSLEGTEGASTAEQVWATLKQLVDHSQLGVDSRVPQLFDQLVSLLAKMDDQQLVKLFDEVRDPRTRGYLLDALPLLGSSGSVWAMYQIYSAGEVSRDEVDSWLTALAFHQQPSLEMLDKLGFFMTDGYHPRTWLAASAVVHSYCKHDPTCQQRREVQAVLATLEAALGQSCHSINRDQQQQVVAALKAIGNAGLINSLETLEQCFTNENNPLEVRLAAVAATRRLPCGLVLRLPLLRMLQDKQEDSELRIAAYLALLQCPSTSIISRLRDVLLGEDTNQVLSFIWTHLTNLQESSSSWRKEVRQMLQDTYLTNKLKTDARKFSRNYEMSAYSDILNSGVTADSNIIFSTKSYLPRSANLNLTLDLFGETINIFEIGTRIEGFESVVENIFGPKGLFPDESMQKMLKNMRETSNERNEVIQSFSKDFTKGINKEPQGEMFVRVLGNELYLSQFTGFGDIMQLKNVKKQSLKYLRDSLASIFTNRNVDYSKSFRFINTQHVIPTILGMPLKVKVNGTASVGMQLKTEVDLDNILKTSSGDINLSVNPSAAISIDGEMTVDASFAQAGVETKGSLSSNTYLDTNLKIEKGKVIDLLVNVPREKIEVINVTSSVFVKKRDQLIEIEGVGEVSEQDSCSGEHVPTLSGMRACSQYVFRNASNIEDSPYFPLTGKFQYALALQKSDDFEFYQFHLKQNFRVVSDINTHKVRFYDGDLNIKVDTPGSKVNRRISADLSFDTRNGNAKLELESPAGSIEFSGRLNIDNNYTSGVAELGAKVNGDDYASVKLGLQTESVARTIKFEPLFLLQIVPNNINVNISGHFHIVQGSKYSADVTAVGLTKQPLIFSGDISGAKGRYSASLSAKAESVDVKINSHVVNTAAVSSCKTLVRYVLPGQAVQSVDFSGKLQSQKKGGFTKKQLLVNLQMSQLPQYNTKVGWILYRTKMYVDSNVELTVGKTQWKSQQLYHNNMQAKNKNFEVILSLESPSKSLDYRAELQYKTTEDNIHSHALAQLSKSKRFIVRADYVDDFPQRTLELEAASPWSCALLEGTLLSTPESQGVNSTVTVKWGPVDNPRWLSATGRYHLAETPLSAQNVLEGKIEVIDWENPVEFIGLWRARFEDGLILSESTVTVLVNEEQYSLNVDYTKNPMKGKHDVKVGLNFPDKVYRGNFLLTNNQEKKNVTIRLDLEKTLYFTTQLQLWKGFDLQLFWNYLEDKSQSVLIQYKNTPNSEIAIVSMPGHYASLTVDKLAPGFSSMNITAMWGESEGSATNAILLSTYWNLNVSLVDFPAHGLILMPVVETKIHLTTPFVGFEQQSFILDVHGFVDSDEDMAKDSVIREVKVLTKWQEQFINFGFIHNATVQSTPQPMDIYERDTLLSFSCSLNSSLEVMRDVSIAALIQDKKEYMDFEIKREEKSHILNLSYNKWVTLIFNSTYTPSAISLLVDISDKVKEQTLFLGEISIQDGLILMQSSLSPDKKVLFESTYHWPDNFVATLKTPFTGLEQSSVLYSFSMNDEVINTKVIGEIGREFFTFLVNMHTVQSKFNGKLDVSSSLTIPDVGLKVEHEIYKSQEKSTLRESLAISLSKGGKILHSGQGLLSFIDHQISVSSKTKQLETMILFPGHSSSLNYTFQSQVKTTGVEVLHELNQLWNNEKTDVSLAYEGLNSIAGFVRRNNDKKAEFSFKKLSNTNYKTDLSLNGGYSLKHRLFFTGLPNWENFLAVTSPSSGKIIIKNLQTTSSEGTSFEHKSTVSLNKEVAYIDLVYNLDSKSKKVQNILFSTTTPWNHPVVAKYDLLIDTGATSKHELELKFKQGQEIKGVFDVTSSANKHLAAFNLYSPYCKDLAGKFSLEYDTSRSRGNLVLNANEKQIIADVELVKNIKNPLLSLSLNNSNEKIINFLANYDVSNIEKEVKIVASFYDREVSLDGYYTFDKDCVKVGFVARTPILGWKEVSLDFDSKLSQKYSMFAVNGKKDETILIVSGTGAFQSDSIKSNVSIYYLFSKEPKKHSALFEYSKGKESILVSFNCKNNEINVIDFRVNLSKEPGLLINQDSYLFTYKAQTPLEILPDSDVEMRFIKNEKAQRIIGDFNINNLKTIIKGENTFDSSGIGSLDLNVITPNRRVGLFLKHSSAPDLKDSYIAQVINNGKVCIDGVVTISNENNVFNIEYGLNSSMDILGHIKGTTVIKPGTNSLNFKSSLTVNGDRSNILYKVSSSENNGEETKHSLNVLLTVNKSELTFRGDLEYKHRDSELVYLSGEITNCKAASKIFYSKVSSSEWTLKTDLAEMTNILAERNESGLVLSVKTSKTESIPDFLINLKLKKSSILFETDNTFMGKIQVSADLSDVTKASFFADFNGLRANGTLHKSSDSLNIEVISTIPDWRELNVLMKQSNADGNKSKKYYININKENQDIFYLSTEGVYGRFQGNGLFSLTVQHFFIDVDLTYEFSSVFSLDLNYNINGNKQHTGGEITFSPDTARLELATPIKGFEDLTITSTLNKKNKKVGFVVQKNGKTVAVEMSATVERQRVIVKGSVTDGKDEFIVSIGAQNGTADEPKSASFYITAFKNKLSVLMISLDGSFDYQTKAGIKFSFSSYFYKQLYFEISSHSEEAIQRFIFNYIYGIDIAYSLKSTIVKELSKPLFIIESNFGPRNTRLDLWYNIENPTKLIAILFSHNDNMLLNIEGKVLYTGPNCQLMLTMQNENVLSKIKNLNISGGYNFKNESLVNSLIIVNDVEYFYLSMNSSSLYKTKLQSSLVPTSLINNSYDISLDYNLALPDLSISSHVRMNEDYYKSKANLTWNESVARVFYQLNTNAGYGFENAVMSAHYEASDSMNTQYSHLIDFTIDDSTLFHIASNISYPNRFSLDVILPDSLFLPFVKEISVGFSFNEEEKTVSLKYLSGSQEKRKFNLIVFLREHQCSAQMGRSEMNEENILQSDSFHFSYKLLKNVLEFETSLIWENNDLFTVSLNKVAFLAPNESKTLSQVLFSPGNYHLWKIVFVNTEVFEFSGVINENEVKVSLTHPSTIFHDQLGVTELTYTNNLEEFNVLNIAYDYGSVVHCEMHFNSPVGYLMNMLRNEDSYRTLSDLVLKHQAGVLYIKEEGICEGATFTNSRILCNAMSYKMHQTGTTNPLSIQIKVNLDAGDLNGIISRGDQEFFFGGKAKMNRSTPICSNVQIYFNSSASPTTPFALRYETNCLNSVSAALNVLEKDTRAVNVIFDFNQMNSNFFIQGDNIYYKDWNISAAFNNNQDKTGILNINLEKNSVKVNLHVHPEKNTLFSVETTYKELTKLEVTLGKEYAQEDFVKNKYIGRFKIEGSKTNIEWKYEYLDLYDGGLMCTITSGNELVINLAFENVNEFSVKVNKGGKLYEGKGWIKSTTYNGQGNAVLSLDGNQYRLVFEHSILIGDGLKAVVTLDTPVDQYFVKVEMQQRFYSQSSQSLRLMSVRYKTPYYPLDSADLKVEFSVTPVMTEEVFSLEDLESSDNKEEKYEVSYSEMVLKVAFKTKNIHIDDALVSVSFGDKYSMNFKLASMKISLETLLLENAMSLATMTTINVEGISGPCLDLIKGKTLLKAYFDSKTDSLLVLIKTPPIENVLITSKSQQIIVETADYDSIEYNRTVQVVFGKETILNLARNVFRNSSFSNDDVESYQSIKFLVNTQWQSKPILKAYLGTTQTNNQVSTMHFDIESKLVQLQSLYSTMKQTDNVLIKSLELHVNKSFLGETFNPKIVFKREETKDSDIEYNLNFTNGFSNEKYLYSGRCSLKLPDIRLFSVDSKRSIIADIFLESHIAQYASVFKILLQRNKLDASINWRRAIKPIKQVEDLQFTSLLFGGHIQKNRAEFYLNDNKFFGSIESSKSLTSISANLVNSKLNKNITVFASVQYAPMFLMAVSHTVFDSPCSIEIKIDRKTQSFESAVIVEYNSLKQQAFVNVYLDSSPRYVELIYIDIWQQTHEVSGQVEEKDNEITVKGKINSPALDENFLIINIGNSNDKFDLNLSDMLIFKVFKDDELINLNLLMFGNDYNLNYKSQDGINDLTVESPVISGVATFTLRETLLESFVTSEINFGTYNFLILVNKEQICNITLINGSENIIHIAVETENDTGVNLLHLQCDILEYTNSLNIKHTPDPVLLVFSIGSSYYLKNNLEVILGIKNEDIVTGIFEVKQEISLIKSYLTLCKENRSLEIVAEAPLFSEMDKAKINGVLKFIDAGDCEMKLSGAISSAETLMAHVSLHFVNSDEVFSTGLVVKSKLNNFNGIEITVDVPLQLSRDMKTNVILQLPYLKSYEFSSSLCISENKVSSLTFMRWQDLLYSLDYKYSNTPFYADLYEWKIQYSDKKMEIGAWMNPKHPLTDYIYFLDLDEKRIMQISHALILQHNHIKSKLIIESVFKGHEKYGVDLELQNLKLAKVVKLLGSVPQVGTDLGVDFAFSYESLLNYAVLAQIRIPYNNQVKTARLTSLQKIKTNLNYTKLNHTLECDGLGAVGWEFEIFGSAPFFWQGDVSALETKVNINYDIYSTKIKSYLQPSKIQLSCVVEAPLAKFQKVELQLSGTKQLIGSELVLSMNSHEIVNASISEDLTNNKHIKILSKWRNVLLKYLYEVYEGELGIGGYICWDLNKKDTSQIGLSVAGKMLEKYETSMELILPSSLVPKLSAKAVFANKVNELFSLLQLDFPGLIVEGKIASDISPVMWKSGIQLKWTPENRLPKDVGLFYVTEVNDDEVKTYFTLQHFALKSDIMLSTYVRNTLYGINLQYSQLKEEELTLELGYWTVQDGDKDRSGMRFTALHPASNTLIYSVANVTSTDDFLEGGISVAYTAKGESGKIRYVEIIGKKNKKIPQVFFGVSSNGNTLGVGGSVWKKDNALQGVTVESRVNQNDPFRLEVVQNTANPGIEAELSYSLRRNYRAYVGMPNNNELTAQISHTMYGRPNIDALATLRLNTSTILWGKFEFPPMTQVGQEFYNGVVEEYSDVTLVSQAISSGLVDFVKEDFSEKVILLLNGMSYQSDLLTQQTRLELNIIMSGFEKFGQTIQRCYEIDHFYLQTGVQHLKQWGVMMQKYTSCIVSAVADTLSNLFAPVTRISLRIWQVVESVLNQCKTFILDLNVKGESPLSQLSDVVGRYRTFRQVMIDQARHTVAHVRHQLSRLEQQSSQWLTQAELTVNRAVDAAQQAVSTHVQKVVDYTETVVAGFSVLGKTVEEMVEIVREGIYRIREVRLSLEWAVRVMDTVNSWFINFRLETYLRQMEMFFDKVVQLIVSDVEKNFGEYEVYLMRAQQFLTGQYEELSKIPQIYYIRSMFNHAYQKARWFWSYAKINERLRDTLRKHFENMRATLDDIENRLDQEEREMRFEYDYNAENSSFTFTQELPFKWQAFNQLPEYNMDVSNGGFSIPAQEYSNMVQTMTHYVWQDAKLLPYLLPPLGADAVISGRKVVTFDNSFYELPVVCGTYLLSADLYHETFSLAINLDQGKRDLLLTTQNVEILVKENFEVYINGNLEDLPLVVNNGKRITLERKPHSVLIASEEGFSIECNAYQEQCKFHLDGWYTGKVGGLFGTYNNEPLDDSITPNREPTSPILEKYDFVNSWALEKTPCDSYSSNVEEPEEELPSYESMCELFFSSQSSPFYPCFHVVDPKAFYNMCLANARKGNTCGTVFAYLTKCTTSGIQLWMPEFCVSDTYSTVSNPLLDAPTVTTSRMTADVVFVVEEADCIRKREFNFSDIPSTLNTELRAKGMKDNRFAFISFNRKDAQIQTINGHIWTEDEKQLENVISRLDSASDLPSAYVPALDLAVNLPFRPGASKMAVLIHCSSCPVDQPHSAVLERLSQQDMSLHILQHDVILGKRGRAVGKAIGLEKSGAYPRKRLGKNVLPSAALLEQVSVPQDLCTPLVLGTNGTLFHMDVVHKGLKAWGGRVAGGSVPPTPLTLCEKTLSADNTPVTRCHWASGHRKLKEWDQTALEEYMDTSKAGDIYTEYEEIDR